MLHLCNNVNSQSGVLYRSSVTTSFPYIFSRVISLAFKSHLSNLRLSKRIYQAGRKKEEKARNEVCDSIYKINISEICDIHYLHITATNGGIVKYEL